MKHLITLEDMSLEWWERLYARCRDIIANPTDYAHEMDGRIMASLFYEPSTRTSFSFQAAMMRLGGKVMGFSDPNTSSVAKGESLADTIRVFSTFSDVAVIRSAIPGTAAEASRWSHCPVINAGDGGHTHPTQTLADLATISMYRSKINDLHIGLCGDLRNGRTVHSLIHALAKFPDIKFTMISPAGLSLPDESAQYLKSRGIAYASAEFLEDALPTLDILYMTRVQKERFTNPAEFERYKGIYVLNKDKLSLVRKDALIMHPLPRVDEIAPEVDDDPRAVYFDQVFYGMYIRMSLLIELLTPEF
ncbi:MAG: aspartate carbamoyltransferase [Oscillospiraceae bacterium]|jgi:aspartate carbamoyltransferase catalytic subunit|nr:aspartate carbamoyltransferase [Oscillospiraceae bacterium]